MSHGNYDRSSQDIGNIVALEHVNVRVPDQGIAALFYVVGLGLTRDPYLMVSTDNMWINVGQQQFHLPTGPPQVLPGHVGLALPDLEALTARLKAVRGNLSGTAFGYSIGDGHVLVTCPWGNRLRCHAPRPDVRDTSLGIAYVEFPVRPGRAERIARFYEAVFGAPAMVAPEVGGAVSRVRVGPRQELVFRETTEEAPPYDGHHVAIYIAHFSRAHAWLAKHGLISEESDEHQYRFQEIVDPETLDPLFTVEHEVRSICHPLYLRPLVNRNPSQRQSTYVRGRDAFVP